MPPKASPQIDFGPPSPPPSKLVHTLEGHTGPVHVIRYNVGSKYLLSGGQDRTIRLWNASSGKEIKTYKGGHAYEVLGVCVSPDNARFGSCGGDKSVYLWDVTSGTVLRRLSAHSGRVNAVEFNKDGSILASASYDATLALWDLKSQMRAPIQTLTDAKDSITSVVIQDATITTGSVDGFVRTYDLRMGQLQSDYMGHPVTSLTPSPTTPSTLLITTLDSHLRLLDRTTSRVLASFTGHTNMSYRTKAAFLRGESAVVVGDENGELWSWGVVDGKVLEKRSSGGKRAVLWTEVREDGAEMACSGTDGLVRIWRK